MTNDGKDAGTLTVSFADAGSAPKTLQVRPRSRQSFACAASRRGAQNFLAEFWPAQAAMVGGPVHKSAAEKIKATLRDTKDNAKCVVAAAAAHVRAVLIRRPPRGAQEEAERARRAHRPRHDLHASAADPQERLHVAGSALRRLPEGAAAAVCPGCCVALTAVRGADCVRAQEHEGADPH